MLSSLLKSEKVEKINMLIIDTFVGKPTNLVLRFSSWFIRSNITAVRKRL